MQIWQISYKHERGEMLHVREFSSLWRVLTWLVRNLSRCRIAVIIKLEE